MILQKQTYSGTALFIRPAAKVKLATLQKGSKKLRKAIKIVKSPKTGAYIFQEKILPSDLVNDWLSKK